MPCFQGASINGSPRLLKSRCPEVQLCASPWQEQDEMLGLKGQCGNAHLFSSHLEALPIPSPAAMTSTYPGCARSLLSHTPSAKAPRGGNATLGPFLVTLCGYPGQNQVRGDAELASVELN